MSTPHLHVLPTIGDHIPQNHSPPNLTHQNHIPQLPAIMKIAKRISKTETALPPCCLRIHPVDTSIMLIGTYQLDKESGVRTGSIDTYRVSENQIHPISSISTVLAILDMKFNPFDSEILALAHSTGNVIIWKVNPQDYTLTKLRDISVAESEILVTSITFSPGTKNNILVTLTSGELLLLDIETGHTDTFSTPHDLECWTGAFGETGPSTNIVFSGGDDAKLVSHDIRTMDKVWATNHRHHDAGVVLILCPSTKWLNHRPNELWTGSYDDCLRVFDLRYLDSDEGPQLFQSLLPTERKKQNLNGGVWRLIPAPNSDKVLACCMYDGARIVEPVGDSFSVTRYFKGEHESMCYGGDWQDPDYVATCSFYDSIVQVWLPERTE